MNKIKYPFSYQEFKSIYSKVPRLTIELVITNKREVLFLLRKDHGWEGLWHLPGATMYYGETILDCVARTAKEELGINVNVKKFLGYNEYPSELKERGFGTAVGLIFFCTISAKNREILLERKDIKFFKKLPNDIVHEHKLFLRKKLKMR